MARFRVVVTDHRLPDLASIREVLVAVDAEAIDAGATTENEVAAAVRDADAVINVRAPVTARAIDQMRRCQVIVRLGIGVDSVDVAAATRRGIPVSNVPDYCVDEVADHTLATLLSWARRLPAFVGAARAGIWEPRRIPAPAPPRLRGQTLGLIGLGRIGRAVAARAVAFGLRVAVFDPYVAPDASLLPGVSLTDLDTLLETADYVSIHCALTDETRGLLGAKAFARMKPSAFLINAARGPILDRGALMEALTAGRIAGAALDAFDVEPLPPKDPLLGVRNLIATPHVAWYSAGSLADLPVLAAREVARVLGGAEPANAVNREMLGRGQGNALG